MVELSTVDLMIAATLVLLLALLSLRLQSNISKQLIIASIRTAVQLTLIGLVGIIDRLEKKKLVSRLRSVKDRRVVYIVATAEGRALEQEVSPQVQKIDERLRSAVSVEEWHSMEETLKKFSSGMAQRDPKLSALAEGTTNN